MAIIGLSAATQLLGIIFPAIHEYWNVLRAELQEFVGHYLIVLLALIMTLAATWSWFQKQWPRYPRLTAIRHKSRHGVIIVLVIAILAFSEFKTNRVVRQRTAQEARARAQRAYTYTESQLQSTPTPDLINQLIILSQGIGQITTRTFDLIQNSHPEFQLRAVSVHVKVNEEWVEDLFQEGEFKKDRTIFRMDHSFVGATIKQRKRMYCPDLLKDAQDQGTQQNGPRQDEKDKKYPDCKEYSAPNPRQYASLICYPLSSGFIRDREDYKKDHENAFAAICLDSIASHAFDQATASKATDKPKDDVYETIRDQLAQLSTLLHAFQAVRTSLQSGKEGANQRSGSTRKSDQIHSQVRPTSNISAAGIFPFPFRT